jgi:hypothetical protein
MSTRKKHVVQKMVVIQSASAIPRCSCSLNDSQSQGGVQNPETLEKIRGGLHGNAGLKWLIKLKKIK